MKFKEYLSEASDAAIIKEFKDLLFKDKELVKLFADKSKKQNEKLDTFYQKFEKEIESIVKKNHLGWDHLGHLLMKLL